MGIIKFGKRLLQLFAINFLTVNEQLDEYMDDVTQIRRCGLFIEGTSPSSMCTSMFQSCPRPPQTNPLLRLSVLLQNDF